MYANPIKILMIRKSWFLALRSLKNWEEAGGMVSFGTFARIPSICVGFHLQSVSWSLAEFCHNKIVQSPHENYFNVCRQHKEK